METLSVGVLIDTVYPYTHGGAEKRFSVLAETLAARGHDVTVYAMKWWDGPRTHEDNGIRYVAVTDPSPMYADGARRTLAQPARYALHAFRSLRGTRHDVVDCNQFPFAHLPMASVSAALEGHALTVTWHEVWGADYWFRYAPLGAGMVGAALEDVLPHLTAGNIAVSQHTARRLRALGAPEERVAVVPNAIDVARLDAVPAGPEQYDIAFVGRLIAHKRVGRLLAAMAHLRRTHPQVRCAIAGSGPEEARLRALAHGLGLDDNVTFTGPLPGEEDVVALLKGSRLFVSASEREGFGIAALEAMACGLPVVTVDAPMNALAEELVEDGKNGRVVAPRARALAEGLGALLDDEPTRRAMARRARSTAARFDRGPVATGLEAAYRTVVDRQAAGTARVRIPAAAP